MNGINSDKEPEDFQCDIVIPTLHSLSSEIGAVMESPRHTMIAESLGQFE